METHLNQLVALGIRKSFNDQSMLRTLNAKMTCLSLGHVEIEAQITDNFLNQHNFAHAGVAFTLGDTAGGYAALSQYKAGSNVMTVEFKVNYLAPAIGERLKAVGRVIRTGKRICVVAADVFVIGIGKEDKIAAMQGTMLPIFKN